MILIISLHFSYSILIILSNPVKYIEDITRWGEDIFKPPCNVLFII